jgi:HAMP domain-containing protein
MRLPLRAWVALLAAALVLLVSSVVGLGGYLSFRASLLSRADRAARTEAHRLAGLVDSSEGGNGQAVDLTDLSLTRQLSTPGLLVSVIRPSGVVVQASPGRDAGALLSAGLPRACLMSGQVRARRSSPPLAVACERVGAAPSSVGAIVVGAPLSSSLASLRRALIVGVLAGGVLAAVLSLLLAGRALRPLKRIAATAETIRSGDLSRRIGDRGGDELGELARVLDACVAELERALERQRRFAADASHETPLAAIRANVELLRGWAGGRRRADKQRTSRWITPRAAPRGWSRTCSSWCALSASRLAHGRRCGSTR